jgi:hypothetical protein
MLIFLHSASDELDVQRAVTVLRRAKLVAKTGALVRSAGEIKGGLLVLEYDRDTLQALDVLNRAGIGASI